MQILLIMVIFVIMHVTIWYASNAQLIMQNQRAALMIALILSIPISLLTFYATKVGYSYFDNLWSVRLLAFGASYLVFPAMTYFYLDESPFRTKTMICIALSIIIMAIQIFWRDP